MSLRKKKKIAGDKQCAERCTLSQNSWNIDVVVRRVKTVCTDWPKQSITKNKEDKAQRKKKELVMVNIRLSKWERFQKITTTTNQESASAAAAVTETKWSAQNNWHNKMP